MKLPIRINSQPWTVLVFTCCLCVFLAIGAALVFGPDRWVSSRSLDVIHDYTHISWAVIGGVWLFAAALLLTPWTRVYGYVLGATLAIVFVGAALFYTTLPGDTTNVVVSLLGLLSPLLLYAGARYARSVTPPRRNSKADR